MTAPKHSPGPWTIGNSNLRTSRLAVCSFDPYGEKGHSTLCRMVSDAHGIEVSTNLANASLIAAAPELLDALAELVSRVAHVEMVLHEQHMTLDLDLTKYAELVCRARGL